MYEGMCKKTGKYQLLLVGISVCRNQDLANVFYRLHLIEAYGTGMGKIMKAYEGMVEKPVLETTKNAFKIILPNINAKYEKGAESVLPAEPSAHTPAVSYTHLDVYKRQVLRSKTFLPGNLSPRTSTIQTRRHSILSMFLTRAG